MALPRSVLQSRLLLSRFLSRPPPSSLPSSSSSAPVSAAERHLFLPAKSSVSSRWAPPVYSARRQAMLARAAMHAGMLEALEGSPKAAKLKERLEAISLVSSSSPSSAAAAAAVGESQSSIRTRALAHAQAKGPYKGRPVKRLFKGKTAERKAPAKAKEVQRKLETMQSEVEGWRKSIRDAKRKARPSLPF